MISAINHAGLNTWAACGDVVRNVIGPAEPDHARDLTPYVRLLGSALKPRTDAYCEIWMDGEKAVSFEADTGHAGGDNVEPLYGSTYLPRKFKIGFSRTGDNTTDIYSNDLGFVAHYDAAGVLEGFTLLAGGGLGQSNGVKLSHPRVASEICFIAPGELLDAAKAVVGIHRDFGNRENRKIARLKYVLDDKGVDWFREELARRLGRPLTPPRPLAWTRHMDYLGWHTETPSTKFFGLRVVNGRIKGNERAAIREIVEQLRLNVTFTVQQNLIFTGIAPVDEPKLEAILRKHGVALPHELPPVLRHSMACPALPTCGQAITESERTSPQLIAKLEAELAAVGLPQEVIHVRMTGCPNGCARPYTAEIGIVGQSVNMYSLYLGGSPMATRLAPLYKHGIKEEEIPGTLRPFFAEFAAERQPGESFGDFFFRKHANG